MKLYKHAQISVRRWGGQPEDYLPIHDWFDQTKSGHADMRHRAILHNSMKWLPQQHANVRLAWRP